jgi:hypothetical protein
MPRTCIDTADAIELAETLQLIDRWLSADPVRSPRHSSASSTTPPTAWTPSAPTWTASPSSPAAMTANIFNEVKALGYDGSYSLVRNYLDWVSPAKAPLPEAPPTVRDVTNWLCRRPGTLAEDEKLKLKAVLDRCPELQTASGLVRRFATMITDLSGQDLPQWMAAARQAALPGISSFAKGWNKTSTPSPTA